MPGCPADRPWRRRLLGGSNRSRHRPCSLARFDQDRTLVQVSGGPGPWILRLDRHRRPARKRRDLDSFEEVGVDRGGRAGTPRAGRTGDGDRGEEGDERHPRDDVLVSHVGPERTTDPPIRRISTRVVTKSESCQHRAGCRLRPIRSWPAGPRRTLAPLSHGSSDHTIRFGPGRAWRTTRTADGPATVALSHVGDEVRAEAFGPGADRALAAVPDLLELDADGGSLPTGHPLVARPGQALPGRPDPADRRGAGVARPGHPRAEGHRPGGAPRAGRADPGPRRGRARAARVAAAARRRRRPRSPPCPTTRTTRSASSSAGPRSSVASPRAPPGSRPIADLPLARGLRPPDGACRGSGRGRRPRSASGRSATRTPSASATSTCRTSSRSRLPASRAPTTPGCSSCSSPTAASAPGSSGSSSSSGIRPPRYGPRLSPRRIESI